MLKFLFGGKKTPEAVPETDRERFKRLTTDLNELIDSLPAKPKVTFDPATGHVTLEEPEQFADEALALPAPEKADAAKASEKVTAGDAVAATGKPSTTPAASQPKQDASEAR